MGIKVQISSHLFGMAMSIQNVRVQRIRDTFPIFLIFTYFVHSPTLVKSKPDLVAMCTVKLLTITEVVILTYLKLCVVYVITNMYYVKKHV
jgi:hypothetical protein